MADPSKDSRAQSPGQRSKDSQAPPQTIAQHNKEVQFLRKEDIKRITDMIHWDKYEQQRRVYGPSAQLSHLGLFPPSSPRPPSVASRSSSSTPAPRGRIPSGPNTQRVASWENVDIYKRENEVLKQYIKQLEKEKQELREQIEQLTQIAVKAGLHLD